MSKQKRNRYSDEFKAEALKLAERTSVASAARELGIHESQIYGWRSAAKKKANVSERESELAAENARLKRQMAEREEELAILKKAATYFAKNQK
ncbi:transposase [Halomonas sp. hl-4]|nr:transposase [Halomonas sp. hl-4]